MKFSFNKILILVSLGCCILSCSKEGDSASASAPMSVSKAGSLSKFAIVGNYLYAVDNNNLYSYNITDPVHPVMTHTTPLSFIVETIYPYNNRLFIGTTAGMFIYSIEDPSAPSKLGEASHVRSCDPVVANDSIAFVTLKGSTRCGPAESGLYIHSIKNVLQPVLIKKYLMNDPEGLGLSGSILYVCCNNNGLKVINVADPANPVEIRTVTGAYFKDVIPYGDLLICYVSTGILLYDISNPTNPSLVKLIAN